MIQGCGYPDYSCRTTSRATSGMRAIPRLTRRRRGWVGRYLAANYVGSDIPGVCVSDGVAGEFRQTATSVLAVRRCATSAFRTTTHSDDDMPPSARRSPALYASRGQLGPADAAVPRHERHRDAARQRELSGARATCT